MIIDTHAHVVAPDGLYAYHLATSMDPASLVAPWVRANNDTIARTVALYPQRFAGVRS